MGKKSRAKHFKEKPFKSKGRIATSKEKNWKETLDKKIAEGRKRTLTELEINIQKLQLIIGKYNPIELMNRAAYCIIASLTYERGESKDEPFIIPSAEYLQYLIARSPSLDKKIELTDEAWDEIWNLLIKIMHLMQSYYFTQTRDMTSGSEIAGLQFMYEMKNLFERVDNYSYFQEDYWRTHLKPVEMQIKELFGITLEELIEGLKQIKNYLQTGLSDRYATFKNLDGEFVELLEAKVKESSTLKDEDISTPEWINKFIEADPELSRRRIEVSEQFEKTFTPEAFNITDISKLPKEILSLLSVKPSESILTDLHNKEDDISPASTSPLHQKPFLELDDKFYCFYHSGFEDKIPNLIERKILELKPEALKQIQEIKSENVEKLATELLTQVINPDAVYRNLYYYNKEGKLAELDTLICVDDIVFLMEAKSGTFVNKDSSLSLIKEYKDSIIAGHNQSLRALNYIQSKDNIDFYDHTGKNIVCSLKKSQIRKIHRIVITRENLGWVGARVGILNEIEPSIKDNAPWHISIEDLRVIVELFKENELQFVHYAEVRGQAANELSIVQNDEIQHIGLYFSMNFYHKKRFSNKKPDFITFDDSFQKEIDNYFSQKAKGELATLPSQNIPDKLQILLNRLKESKLKGRFEIASFILDFATVQRDILVKGLDYIQKGVLEGKQRTMKIPSDELSLGLTITNATEERLDQEMIVSAAQAVKSNCQRWYVLQLSFDLATNINQIRCITPEEFSEAELELGSSIIEKRVLSDITMRKIGRNDPCPCGSGKKYKKCHLFPSKSEH